MEYNIAWNNDVPYKVYKEEESKIDELSAFKSILKELHTTYVDKNHDYGNSFDKSLDTFGIIAAITRISDKYNRIESLTLKNRDNKVKDESIEDTLLDLANYCIMTVKWLRSKK